eukprot:UN05718
MCENSNEKLNDVRQKVYNITLYEESLAANKTSNVLHKQTDDVYQYTFGGLTCDNDVAYNNIKAQPISVTKKVCASADITLIGFIDIGPVEVCKPITVASSIPYNLT